MIDDIGEVSTIRHNRRNSQPTCLDALSISVLDQQRPTGPQ